MNGFDDNSENYSLYLARLFNQKIRSLSYPKKVINESTTEAELERILPLRLRYMIDDYEELFGQANS